MARYIDADALMDFLTIMPIDLGYREIDDVEEYVKRQPAADVAPVRHGEWIGTEFDGYADGKPVFCDYEWRCSACGCIFEDEEPTWDFCPCCGAKMDGGDGDA